MPVEIDAGERFPRLPRAPITEAVIEFRALALAPWDEEGLAQKLKERLSEYPHWESRRKLQGTVELRPGESPRSQIADLGWAGLRARSADRLQIAQFRRDRFAFSRLAPYKNWENFEAEALRLWEVYSALARPAEIQRLGVRFINQLPVPKEDLELEDYFTARATPLPG